MPATHSRWMGAWVGSVECVFDAPMRFDSIRPTPNPIKPRPPTNNARLIHRRKKSEAQARRTVMLADGGVAGAGLGRPMQFNSFNPTPPQYNTAQPQIYTTNRPTQALSVIKLYYKTRTVMLADGGVAGVGQRAGGAQAEARHVVGVPAEGLLLRCQPVCCCVMYVWWGQGACVCAPWRGCPRGGGRCSIRVCVSGGTIP